MKKKEAPNHAIDEAGTKRPRLNAPQTWTENVENVLRSDDIQDVRKLHNELQRLTKLAESRMQELSPTCGLAVVLVDANTSTEQDINNNSCTRHVDAEFLIGPRKARFSVAIEHENEEGDLRTNISSSPDLISVEDSEPNKPDDSDIEEFLKEAGLEQAIPNSWSDSSKDVSAMNRNEVRCWVYSDIVDIMVKQIAEKKGHDDGFGVGLGIEEGDMYKWLQLT